MKTKTVHEIQKMLKEADKGQRAYPTYGLRRLIFKVQVVQVKIQKV